MWTLKLLNFYRLTHLYSCNHSLTHCPSPATGWGEGGSLVAASSPPLRLQWIIINIAGKKDAWENSGSSTGSGFCVMRELVCRWQANRMRSSKPPPTFGKWMSGCAV